MGDNVPYKSIFNKGDHLILELVSGDMFRGDYEGGGKDYLELTNVRERFNPNESKGELLAFYRKEINKIRRTKIAEPEKPFINPNRKDQEKQKMIKIEYEDYRQLREMGQNYIYIDGITSSDKYYQRIMNKLTNTETIGICPIGMKPTRDTTIGLLAISTWKEVFLFNLVGQKEFYPEIKEMLESEYVCKVLHKAGPFADVLYRKYNIYVHNIFDTQAVDLIIRKSKSGKCPKKEFNISECLAYHLNFPMGVIREARECYEEEDWSERPLSDDKKLYASQLTTYLIVLRDEMKQVMLSKTFKTIDSIYDYYYDLNDYDYCIVMNSRKVHRDVKKLLPLIGSINLDVYKPKVECCCLDPAESEPKKSSSKSTRKINEDYWQIYKKPQRSKTVQDSQKTSKKVETGKHEKKKGKARSKRGPLWSD